MRVPSMTSRLYFVLSFVGIVFTLAFFYFLGNLPFPKHVDYSRMQAWVFDENGRELVNLPGAELPFSFAETQRPPALYRPRLTETSRAALRFWIIKIAEAPARYLIFRPRIEAIAIGLLALFIVVPMLMALNLLYLFLLVRYARRRGRDVQSVVSRLKSGDLKARFQITQLDEIGRSMQSFNEMAGEIERLVDRVRAVEAKRRQLLRELAHDVRTPLTALRYLVETVADPTRRLTVRERREKMELATNELDYFQRLIEDLFLLAEAEDSGRDLQRAPVDVVELVRAEARRLEKLVGGRRVVVDTTGLGALPPVIGGEPYLLRRLFGNALANAFHHARRRVDVLVEYGGDGRLAVYIRDDGPGFTAESLRTFGQRRRSRFLDAEASGKVSLGLGSVIMKTVAEVHGGAVTAANRSEGGAEIRIELPLEGRAAWERVAA